MYLNELKMNETESNVNLLAIVIFSVVATPTHLSEAVSAFLSNQHFLLCKKISIWAT